MVSPYYNFEEALQITEKKKNVQAYSSKRSLNARCLYRFGVQSSFDCI